MGEVRSGKNGTDSTLVIFATRGMLSRSLLLLLTLAVCIGQQREEMSLKNESDVVNLLGNRDLLRTLNMGLLELITAKRHDALQRQHGIKDLVHGPTASTCPAFQGGARATWVPRAQILPGGTLDRVLATRRISVGVFESNRQFVQLPSGLAEGTVLRDGAISGFDVSLLRDVVEKIGLHYGVVLSTEFKYFSWCSVEGGCDGKSCQAIIDAKIHKASLLREVVKRTGQWVAFRCSCFRFCGVLNHSDLIP